MASDLWVVNVKLKTDRMQYGQILASMNGEFYSELLVQRCLGRADQGIATSHGNPTRDSLKPFGDTPTGIYRMKFEPFPQGMTGDPLKHWLRSYGPYGKFRLTPLMGDALKAVANYHRDGLLMHGGDLTDDGKNLRPSEGCVRTDNHVLKMYADAIGGGLVEACMIVTEQ